MSLRVNLVTNPSPQTSRGIGKGGGGRMNLGTKGYYLCTLYALEGGGGGAIGCCVQRVITHVHCMHLRGAYWMLCTEGYYSCTLYALEGGLLDAVYRGLLLMYTVCT